MLQNWEKSAPIVIRLDAITRQQIEHFAEATCSRHYKSTPLTFATAFRVAEFRWLDRLQFDMRKLLHTDQEYEYLRPFREGDVPTVCTGVKECRERRGIVFVVLESEIRCGEEVAVIARSSFVVRKARGESL